MKWYGSIDARLSEGKNYLNRAPQAGDDITLYHWSDQTCYYITEVISDKEIKVRPYYVCAEAGNCGPGHQNWKYVKSINERNKYLNEHFGNKNYDTDLEESAEETWVYRYGKWMEKITFNQKTIDTIKARAGWCTWTPRNAKEAKKLERGESIVRYLNLDGKISFGIRDYYYDWTF